MREIKFRVRNIQGKRWVDVPNNSCGYEDNCVMDFVKNKDYHVMQYTELKDKNGKEIYEGDIVMYPDTKSEFVDVGIGNQKVAERTTNSFYPVEFMDGAFVIKVDKTSEVLSEGYWNLHQVMIEYVESIEVIGNIYEDEDTSEKH